MNESIQMGESTPVAVSGGDTVHFHPRVALGIEWRVAGIPPKAAGELEWY